MARAATTSDVFNAVAEPRRRRIVEILSRPRGSGGSGGGHRQPARGSGDPRLGGWSVNELVEETGLPQPAISKHLAVLRKTGIVAVERHRRQRIYRLEPKELKSIFDWTKMFEQFWTPHLESIKERAERRARMIVPQPENLPNPMFHLPLSNATSNRFERN